MTRRPLADGWRRCSPTHSDGAGRGSEFVIRLPLGPATVQPATGVQFLDPRPPAHGPSRRILVVDDNRDAAESLAEVLRLKRHDVRVAYDGLTAVELADAFRPDVIFMDLGMPGMSGYAVTRQLRQRRPSGFVLVAVTGFAQDDHRRLTHEVGFDRHLVKPVDLEAVERLLHGRA